MKHAARTLLKAGEREVLELFGFGAAKHVKVRDLKLSTTELCIGETIAVEFRLHSRRGLGPIRLEYAVDYRKARGHTTRKVFRISESDIPGNEKRVKRKVHFKQLSTRRLHPGEHGITILVNGEEKAGCQFKLLP